MTLPIRCRRAGEEGWIDGETINISRSGVLFRTSEPLDVNTRIEMRIVLAESPVRTGELRCDGHVVRIESVDSSTRSMAAAFSRSSLRPRTTEISA